jgi:enoyl-CoA hydratase/carnithine racemase
MTSDGSQTNDVVLYRVEEGVAVLTLNRPERMNAITPELERRYFELLEEAGRSPEVRVIVVTGAGKGFCAGADVQALADLGAGRGWEGAGRPQIFPTGIPKPIVAAINGACAGLGLVWALVTDVRFAAAGAKFTTAFVRRGLIAEHGSSWLLPRLVGHGRALDLLLSGRVFLAEEALEIGLVQRVLPPEELLPAALEYARDLAKNCSPAAMATIKWQLYRHSAVDLPQALEESNAAMVRSLRAQDFREGVASFIERRPPRFEPLPPGSWGYAPSEGTRESRGSGRSG